MSGKSNIRTKSLNEAATHLRQIVDQRVGRSPRFRSLRDIGGTKQIALLPRKKRALVLASLMEEEPTKVASRQKCLLAAFECALEKKDIAPSKTIFGKLGEEQKARAKELVRQAIPKLREEQNDGLANMLEVAFALNQETTEHFRKTMEVNLKASLDEASIDLAASRRELAHILEKTKLAGCDELAEKAALGLASSYLNSRDVSRGFAILQEHFIEEGVLKEGVAERLMPEFKFLLMNTGEGALAQVAEAAEESGALPALQKTLLELASEGIYGDVQLCEKIFRIMLLLKLEPEAHILGAYLVDFHLGVADAEPRKFYEHYLKAARIGTKVGMAQEAASAVNEYMDIVCKFGEGEFLMLESGARVALEFSRMQLAHEFGEAAIQLYLEEGMLEQAQSLAGDLGMDALEIQISKLGLRSML